MYFSYLCAWVPNDTALNKLHFSVSYKSWMDRIIMKYFVSSNLRLFFLKENLRQNSFSKSCKKIAKMFTYWCRISDLDLNGNIKKIFHFYLQVQKRHGIVNSVYFKRHLLVIVLCFYVEYIKCARIWLFLFIQNAIVLCLKIFLDIDNTSVKLWTFF